MAAGPHGGKRISEGTSGMEQWRCQPLASPCASPLRGAGGASRNEICPGAPKPAIWVTLSGPRRWCLGGAAGGAPSGDVGRFQGLSRGAGRAYVDLQVTAHWVTNLLLKAHTPAYQRRRK